MQEQEFLCFWVVIQFRRPDKYHETFNGFLRATNLIAARKTIQQQFIPLLQKEREITEPDIRSISLVKKPSPSSGMTDIEKMLLEADPVLAAMERQMAPEGLSLLQSGVA
jgi:hypothetical protein